MKSQDNFKFGNKPVNARECGFVIEPGTDKTCGEHAAIHIYWNKRHANSYFCTEHKAQALAYEHLNYHYLQPLCGMPGVHYHEPSNTCRMTDKGIPVAEQHNRELTAK